MPTTTAGLTVSNDEWTFSQHLPAPASVTSRLPKTSPDCCPPPFALLEAKKSPAFDLEQLELAPSPATRSLRPYLEGKARFTGNEPDLVFSQKESRHFDDGHSWRKARTEQTEGKGIAVKCLSFGDRFDSELFGLARMPSIFPTTLPSAYSCAIPRLCSASGSPPTLISESSSKRRQVQPRGNNNPRRDSTVANISQTIHHDNVRIDTKSSLLLLPCHRSARLRSRWLLRSTTAAVVDRPSGNSARDARLATLQRCRNTSAGVGNRKPAGDSDSWHGRKLDAHQRRERFECPIRALSTKFHHPIMPFLFSLLQEKSGTGINDDEPVATRFEVETESGIVFSQAALQLGIGNLGLLNFKHETETYVGCNDTTILVICLLPAHTHCQSVKSADLINDGGAAKPFDDLAQVGETQGVDLVAD
ncbi:hypothetical protein C8F01DRAFT_1235611 [Mycena amicta]|nr:hypothetical protein C8F01DRAFT_1235611 [Mycena amicta]